MSIVTVSIADSPSSMLAGATATLNSAAASAASSCTTKTDPGPATIAITPTSSCWPSLVQIAPRSAQGRPGRTSTVTSAFESGSIVRSHRSSRPATRFAAVTVPPVTSTPASRISSAVIASASLNWICTVNALDPSCVAGIVA